MRATHRLSAYPARLATIALALAGVFAPACPLAEQSDGVAVSAYVGRYTRDTLIQVFTETFSLNFDDKDYIGVIAISTELRRPTPMRSWELEAQLGKHFSGQSHVELNLAVFHRWRRFPWNQRVRTTMAIGAGLSYAFEDPILEAINPSNDGTTRLQSYLGFEATLAPPEWQHFSFLFRVHHRSTVAEQSGDGDSGSNYLSFGGRYEF